MGLTVQEETDAPAWDRYVGAHPQATQYHRWVWKGVVEESFGHRTYYLSARDNGSIVGLLPLAAMESWLFGKYLVSMPFVNYGGLLGDGSEAEEALLMAARDIGQRRGATFVELRHLEKRLTLSASKEHKVAMVLPLKGDVGSQWESFGAKLRNQIRKSQKSDLTCVVGAHENLNDFYHVFSVNMRDLGTPVYARRFFETVTERLGESCKVLVVRRGGRAVAGGIVLTFRDGVEIPWASSIRQYHVLCPNNMLYWEAIQWAVAHGFKRFDFGRSTPGEGTYRFKEQWGARPLQLYWQYLLLRGAALPDLSPTNARYRFAIDLWRRMPVRLTRWIGPKIVKYIP